MPGPGIFDFVGNVLSETLDSIKEEVLINIPVDLAGEKLFELSEAVSEVSEAEQPPKQTRAEYEKAEKNRNDLKEMEVLTDEKIRETLKAKLKKQISKKLEKKRKSVTNVDQRVDDFINQNPAALQEIIEYEHRKIKANDFIKKAKGFVESLEPSKKPNLKPNEAQGKLDPIYKLEIGKIYTAENREKPTENAHDKRYLNDLHGRLQYVVGLLVENKNKKSFLTRHKKFSGVDQYLIGELERMMKVVKDKMDDPAISLEAKALILQKTMDLISENLPESLKDAKIASLDKKTMAASYLDKDERTIRDFIKRREEHFHLAEVNGRKVVELPEMKTYLQERKTFHQEMTEKIKELQQAVTNNLIDIQSTDTIEVLENLSIEETKKCQNLHAIFSSVNQTINKTFEKLFNEKKQSHFLSFKKHPHYSSEDKELFKEVRDLLQQLNDAFDRNPQLDGKNRTKYLEAMFAILENLPKNFKNYPLSNGLFKHTSTSGKSLGNFIETQQNKFNSIKNPQNRQEKRKSLFLP